METPQRVNQPSFTFSLPRVTAAALEAQLSMFRVLPGNSMVCKAVVPVEKAQSIFELVMDV